MCMYKIYSIFLLHASGLEFLRRAEITQYYALVKQRYLRYFSWAGFLFIYFITYLCIASTENTDIP